MTIYKIKIPSMVVIVEQTEIPSRVEKVRGWAGEEKTPKRKRRKAFKGKPHHLEIKRCLNMKNDAGEYPSYDEVAAEVQLKFPDIPITYYTVNNVAHRLRKGKYRLMERRRGRNGKMKQQRRKRRQA